MTLTGTLRQLCMESSSKTLQIEQPPDPTIPSSWGYTCPSEIQCLPACPVLSSPTVQATACFLRVSLVSNKPSAAAPPHPCHTVPWLLTPPGLPSSPMPPTDQSPASNPAFPRKLLTHSSQASRLAAFLLSTPQNSLSLSLCDPQQWLKPRPETRASAMHCGKTNSWSLH